MTNAIACLIHLLATKGRKPVNVASFVDVLFTDDDIEHAVTMNAVSRSKTQYDKYWLELTNNGEWLAEESRALLEAAA